MCPERILEIKSKYEDIVNEYHSVPVAHLIEQYNVSATAKNRFNVITEKIILSADIKKSGENIIYKTIHLNKYGGLKESISLKTFKYYDLCDVEWENSDLYKLFNESYFAFVVFKDEKKDTFLSQIILWKMPNDVLNTDVYNVWYSVRKFVNEGRIVKYIDDQGRFHTYFPSQSETLHIHVRPHAQNRNDTFPLPVNDILTGLSEFQKHSFWINRNYVLKILRKESENAVQ